MLVVIQCAATKRPDGGYMRTRDGRRVLFVAQPELAPRLDDVHFARPDDLSDTGGTWREVLVTYNASPSNNPLGLLPAAALYMHPAYARLVDMVGNERVFILSAGWGILPASFLTPSYDITFSNQAALYKRRRRTDAYSDFLLQTDSDAPMLFFGGKDYAPLFAHLTRTHRAQRTVFFNSQLPPNAPGCRLERFVTTTRTNWHYECVDAWLSRSR